MGYLHQVGNGDVGLAALYHFIFLRVDAYRFGHFADGDVEHVAQSAQPLAYLFQLVFHLVFV